MFRLKDTLMEMIKMKDRSIEVIKKTCEFCGHPRAFAYLDGRKKCCKCKRELK